ncbi:MAG: germination protein YpeB [Clostridia bacterium]|nr:germination protein YpeB [Clostridia bacterium]
MAKITNSNKKTNAGKKNGTRLKVVPKSGSGVAVISERKHLGLMITIWVLSGLLVLSLILYAASIQNANNLASSLEDIYQKNFYDLVDNVNNTETKLAKVLSSTDETYQAKMLEEISKNSNMAQENLNNLPYSINGLDESIKFINQVSGYSDILSKNLKKGETLSDSEYKTLENIYDSVLNMKDSLNQMSKDMWNGYSILRTSNSLDGDYNVFTNSIGSIKTNGVEYPTMIYDGPFADSQVKKEIKGLKGSVVTQAVAKQHLLEVLVDFTENTVDFENETKGNFETYDFSVKDNNNEKDIRAYVQMTKIGGNLLTLSAYNANKEDASNVDFFKNENMGSNKLNKENLNDEGLNKKSKEHLNEKDDFGNSDTQNTENQSGISQRNIDENFVDENKEAQKYNNLKENQINNNKLSLNKAEAIALDFAKKNKLENMKVVWSDAVGGNAFINLAPIQNETILYPDLVKLKIDLYSGSVLGYEATAYYTNHINRTIQKGGISIDTAKSKIGGKYVVEEERLALIPLDYNKEILCYEFICKYGGDDYYFYINTETGKEENILKVIQTDNGNLLM